MRYGFKGELLRVLREVIASAMRELKKRKLRA